MQGGLKMQHIIIDLEFIRVNDSTMRRKCKNEVIEIGAIKLNENYEYVDSFDLFVRPEYSHMTKAITELTGITESDILTAPTFDEAMDKFSRWIGYEKYRIYQWSDSDHEQIIRECTSKGLDLKYDEFFCKHWIDLQRIYGRITGIFHSVSLEKALDSLSIEFKGRMHRAVDDAANTASILQIIKDRNEFDSRFVPVINIMNIPSHTSTLGSILGDKLAEMYKLVEAC